MYMKICVVGDVLDVITYAKFQNEIFRGYNFTGVEFFIFLIDFEWALQQCSATALPVINMITTHCRSEMYAGRVACCPLVADGTDARPLYYAFRSGPRSV